MEKWFEEGGRPAIFSVSFYQDLFFCQDIELVSQFFRFVNLSIPNDFSLIMFDDVEWASMFGISAVVQPVEYIGLSTSRLMIDRICKKNLSSETISLSLEPQLILRNSTRKLK